MAGRCCGHQTLPFRMSQNPLTDLADDAIAFWTRYFPGGVSRRMTVGLDVRYES